MSIPIRSRLPEGADLVVEEAAPDEVFVASVGVGDLGGGEIQLQLAEFDDGTAAGVVTGASEGEGARGLIEEFAGDVDPLLRVSRGRPGEADFADGAVFLWFCGELADFADAPKGRGGVPRM